MGWAGATSILQWHRTSDRPCNGVIVDFTVTAICQER